MEKIGSGVCRSLIHGNVPEARDVALARAMQDQRDAGLVENGGMDRSENNDCDC